jgi:hypothetical protein
MNRGSEWCAMDDKTVAREALKLRARLLRDPTARAVPARGNNFNPR